jgi:type I restriction enzyme S subunit
MNNFKLGELIEITSSKRIHAEDYVESGIPFYRSKEIIQLSRGENITEILYISVEQYSKIKLRFPVPKNGDILLTSVGTIGIPYYVRDENFYFKDGNLTWFRNFSEKINSKYLLFWMQSNFFKSQINNNNIGAVQKALTIDFLKKFNIQLPNLKTQSEITYILTSIVNKIELNNKINAELEAMAKTLYDYWFVQFDFPDTNGKPYKSSGGKMVWNAELNREIPEGWEVGNIMTLANLLGGGTPKTDNPNYWSGDIPFFTPADAEDSIYSTSTKQNITEIGLKNSSTKRYSKGTIFVTARGTVGKINIASQDMAMNQSCYALQGKENVNSQFLYFYTNELVHYIKSKASGSIFKALVTNDFKFTKMIVPPISLLQNYDVFSKSIFAKVLNNKQENQELAVLRDWLLPMLMNGQVSVGDVAVLRQAQDDMLGMVAEESTRYGK